MALPGRAPLRRARLPRAHAGPLIWVPPAAWWYRVSSAAARARGATHFKYRPPSGGPASAVRPHARAARARCRAGAERVDGRVDVVREHVDHVAREVLLDDHAQHLDVLRVGGERVGGHDPAV